MAYLIYLVASDESATILNTPVHVSESKPTEITDGVLLEVVKGLLADNGVTLPDEITTGIDALNWMREECIYYSEDTFVAVEDTGNVKDRLEAIGDALLMTMGDDSSCYQAAASWREIVKSYGEEISEFKVD
jgi:hypothetical protein